MMDDDSAFNSIFNEGAACKSQLTTRGELGGLVRPGIAVEVGTHRGEFAAAFASNFEGKLFCVDPYINGYDESDPVSSSKRHFDFLAATDALMDFIVDCKVEFIIQTSAKAVTRFKKHALDFVYIDAKRQYDDLTEDLENWYDKVKIGGYIGGCGIADNLDQSWRGEVRPAVFDFVKKLPNLPDVYIICERDSDWSYYFRK